MKNDELDKAFSKGWKVAVDWVYKLSLEDNSSKGLNPKGWQVTNKIKSLAGDESTSGFGEGLIWAIGRPIEQIKKKLD